MEEELDTEYELELELEHEVPVRIPVPRTELGDAIDKTINILSTRLDSLKSSSSAHYSFIFKVPHQICQVNKRVYTPQLISIGPYHHDSDQLKVMEIHKVRYLKYLLRRYPDQPIGLNLEYLGDCLSSSINMACSCYEPTEMSSAEFLAMMVLDGCFVVELIRKFMYPDLRNYNDALFMKNLNLVTIAQDLLLLENQLPFFVLNKVFQATPQPDYIKHSFAYMALQFFSKIMPGPGIVIPANGREVNVQQTKHLLDLVHEHWLPSPYGLVLSPKLHKAVRKAAQKSKFMRSATELVQFGIHFKKGKGGSLFDIMFDNGALYIPTLTVNYNTERIFRNLIAYEQFNQRFTIIMDYARLMDCLINNADDVALLSYRGIIDNWLGSNEEVANMFNKLNDYVYLSEANFYYSTIFDAVNQYCNGRWNQCKLKLRTKHSHNPWDWVLISIMAATFLLLLTVSQTVFAILDYLK